MRRAPGRVSAARAIRTCDASGSIAEIRAPRLASRRVSRPSQQPISSTRRPRQRATRSRARSSRSCRSTTIPIGTSIAGGGRTRSPRLLNLGALGQRTGPAHTRPHGHGRRRNRMRVGILGSGLMGGKLGTLFARAGHDVVFSYARSRKKLEKLARGAGSNARAGTPREAAHEADALLLAGHWSRVADVLTQAGALSGREVMSCSLPMNA